MQARRPVEQAPRKVRITVLGCAALLWSCAHPLDPKSSPAGELIREARLVAEREGGPIWPSFAAEPFRILLVQADGERLYCFAEPAPQGFTETGYDPVAACPAAVRRPAQFPPNLLATFPLGDGVPTIVIGAPEATGKVPHEWVVTLLHEHFHQLQYNCERYGERTLALDLHDGDQTGMWMLAYPFPYDDKSVGEAVKALADAAAQVLVANDNTAGIALRNYADARRGLERAVSPRDLRYYDFQAWQEGTARFVERSFASRWRGHPATPASERARLVEELRAADLQRDRRTAFYPLGAAEAFMLQRFAPGWQKNYCQDPMSLWARLARAATGAE